MTKRRSNNEGSIYRETSTGLWVGEITLPDGRRRRKRSKKQSVVREWVQESINTVKVGTYVDSEKLTVAQYLDYYLESIERSLRPKTIDSYKYIIDKHIKPGIGDIRLQKLTTEQIQAFYNKKQDDGLSPRTVEYIHSVLRRALNQAVATRKIIVNPTTFTIVPSPSRKPPEILTVDQIKQFLESVRDHRFYPIYCIAIGCGLREGEILGLRIQDINLPESSLSVQQTVVVIRGKLTFGEPKTDRSRRLVFMPLFVINAVKEHIQKNNLSEGLLFSTSTGRPISPRNLLRHFHESLEKAGIPRVKFHSLRHSFASVHLLSGTNPKIVQEALGHSTISLTLDTYSHIIPSLQKEAAEKIDGIFK